MYKEMTISEFLKRNNNDMDQVAGFILKNSKLKKFFVVGLASLMYAEKCYAATNTNKIDKAGMTILNIVRTFGYWICIIMCIIEIIKSLMQGDTKSVGKIIAKYVIGFGSFFFLPWFFDVIKDIFK